MEEQEWFHPIQQIWEVQQSLFIPLFPSSDGSYTHIHVFFPISINNPVFSVDFSTDYLSAPHKKWCFLQQGCGILEMFGKHFRDVFDKAWLAQQLLKIISERRDFSEELHSWVLQSIHKSSGKSSKVR